VTILGFIAAKKGEHSIAIMCRVLGVSRSGFHAWRRREPSARALEDERWRGRIREIHQGNRGVYGASRIHAELRLVDGERIGRKRAERLMRAERPVGAAGQEVAPDDDSRSRRPGVRGPRRPALRRRRPDRIWVADITYLRSWEGWLYLAAIQDLFSRRIVGWSMADRMRSQLVVDALEMALQHRRTAPGLIHHSDQGSQVRVAGLRPSGPRGRDRAVDGQPRRLLRQRRRRELLRHARERAHPPPTVADEGRTADRGVRLHRAVLQPPAPPRRARPDLAGAVRTTAL
jgi:hypothetical protein